MVMNDFKGGILTFSLKIQDFPMWPISPFHIYLNPKRNFAPTIKVMKQKTIHKLQSLAWLEHLLLKHLGHKRKTQQKTKNEHHFLDHFYIHQIEDKLT